MIATDVFVTGTDTEVGKTRISVAVMALLQQRGFKTAGMKPVASGCENTSAGLQNEDALALMAQADVSLPYSVVNPYAFEPAIAPHIAAQQVNVDVSIAHIQQQLQQIKQQAERVVVEGAGGWFVPLNQRDTIADLAQALKLPVVLVVAVKLGCINHALLSVKAIESSGLPLLGWVANHLEESNESVAIIDTLTQQIQAPCLGVVPFLQTNEIAHRFLCQEAEA